MKNSYDGSLDTLFDLLAASLEAGGAPTRPRRDYPGGWSEDGQGDLFAEGTAGSAPLLPVGGRDAPSAFRRSGLYGDLPRSSPGLDRPAGRVDAELRRVSPAAYDDFLHAWLSELPVEAELLAFARGVLAAARTAQGGGNPADPLPAEPSPAARLAAERARTDRGRPETATVLAAAQSTRVEYHRLLGLLRFRPSAEGPLVARCAPDHLVLPLMADHFSRRFGDADWAVVDERRSLVLLRLHPEAARPAAFDPADPPFAPEEGLRTDEYEALWRGYYRAVNIENRVNPSLRRRLMPVRYWKYLVEV